MKDIYRAIALLAENPSGLVQDIDRASGFFVDPVLSNNVVLGAGVPSLDLSRQFTTAALHDIDDIFQHHDLQLSAYSLAEINRWFFEDRELFPGTKTRKGIPHLAACWSGLTPEARLEISVCPGLQEAFGALMVDEPFRNAFYGGTESLRGNGFDVTPSQESLLKPFMNPVHPVSVSAGEFFADTWCGKMCIIQWKPWRPWISICA